MPSQTSPLLGRAFRGFTLVELLTSMSVLTLLMVMVAQMVGATTTVTSAGSRHLDADTQARLVLDRMAVDFAQIVKRSDVDYYFQKNAIGSSLGPDDQMAFYSETSGYYPSGVTGAVPKSNVSLVGYRIRQRQLQRLDKALVWNGVDSSTSGASGLGDNSKAMMKFLPFLITNDATNSVWPDVAGGGNDPDYHTIGEQIFRMETTYLVRNADTSAKYTDTLTPYNGLHDVSAIVVTLAVLDDRSRLFVTTDTLNAVAAKLDDSTGTNSSTSSPPAQRWLAQVNNGALVSAGLPRIAASQVRVYERCFFLGNTQ